MKFNKAWKYLNNHKIFKDEIGNSRFNNCLYIQVVKVNPKTNKLEEKSKLNTRTEIWLEAGPYIDGELCHDRILDCGAKTFEKAIIKLAEKVKKYYGKNGEKRDIYETIEKEIPEVKTSEIKTPEEETSEVEISEVKTPEEKTPEVEISEVKK